MVVKQSYVSHNNNSVCIQSLSLDLLFKEDARKQLYFSVKVRLIFHRVVSTLSSHSNSTLSTRIKDNCIVYMHTF